ncbi:MAG: DNA mismatch repair endonuclease MutL [Monoglobales bacterium]
MGLIHVLDTEISNKIAAGEVVERPASVIKELVENSIDAGATNITVEIKNGGVTYMRVSDNGCGMSADDAKICFLRHATSKIQTENDLDAIYTLGFRGEALSSIGAVAKVSLFTKRHEDHIGICVTCRGGEILSSEEAGIPDGTSIIAEDLFYNTPARLKFLKKDATEAGYITDIMTRFIFAHPEISFKLTVNGKDKLFSPGDSSLKNAVYTAYGKDYAKGTLEVDYEENGIHVTGLIGKGTLTRPNRNYQSFFVNKRYIKSALIIRAVEDAYKNQIMIGKFPMAVLNIQIDPSFMDINVHPTKLEVKFANEKAVRNAVYYAVKNALYALPNVPEIERIDKNTGEVLFKRDTAVEQIDIPSVKQSPDIKPAQSYSSSTSKEENRSSVHAGMLAKQNKMVFFNDSTPNTNTFAPSAPPVFYNDANINTKSDISTSDHYEIISTPSAAISNNSSEMNKFAQQSTLESKNPETDTDSTDINPITNTDEINVETRDNVFIDEYFKIVGQVFSTYIIAEKGDKMLLIDQHAAHERLKYEELKKALENKQIMSQILIEPVIVKMTPSELSAFFEVQNELQNMGFECDEFGDNEVIVRSAPGDLDSGEVEELLLELVTNASVLKHELITEKNERMLYTIACKSAIKANHHLSTQEMETLVRNVLRLKNINTCPHGRPIIITMSQKEIEKEFKRIV